MNIWSVEVPIGTDFAEMHSAYVESKGVSCTVCNFFIKPPLLVEWEEGSDQIGDFVFALGGIILKQTVADDLLTQFKGFEKREIQFIDRPSLYKPEKYRKRKKRIWLPYDGPELCELYITKNVKLHESSSVKIEYTCQNCGRIQLINGVEGVETDKRLKYYTSRENGKGLFIQSQEIGGYDFFGIRGTGYILCTDRVREYVHSKGYSNISFLDYGAVI